MLTHKWWCSCCKLAGVSVISHMTQEGLFHHANLAGLPSLASVSGPSKSGNVLRTPCWTCPRTWPLTPQGPWRTSPTRAVPVWLSNDLSHVTGVLHGHLSKHVPHQALSNAERGSSWSTAWRLYSDKNRRWNRAGVTEGRAGTSPSCGKLQRPMCRWRHDVLNQPLLLELQATRNFYRLLSSLCLCFICREEREPFPSLQVLCWDFFTVPSRFPGSLFMIRAAFWKATSVVCQRKASLASAGLKKKKKWSERE